VWSGLATSGTALFGTTEEGGAYGQGTIFRLGLDGSDFKVLKHLTKPDGAHPMGDLMVSGSTLFGTAAQEGLQGGGTLFRMNLDGSGFVVLKQFGGTDGSGPRGGVTRSGDFLFGTTHDGGAAQPYAIGTVYRVRMDGSDFAVLHSYGNTDGNNPCGTLVASGSTLYGTTDDWSIGIGTVFKLNTDGTGYTIIKQFNKTDGRMPIGSLILSGATLYGTTIHGGPYDWGTVFKINTDGTGFDSLRSFPWVGMPYGGLTQMGQMLFGTTDGGGPTDQGIIFRINADGSDYAVMRELEGTNGSGPVASMILLGADLYGTTRYGGVSNAGVIFKISVAPPTITRPPRSATAEVGSVARLSVGIDSCAPAWRQWWLNGVEAVAKMTSISYLSFTSVQFYHAGSYTVVVSNCFGSVTSPPAILQVIPRVEHRLAPIITLRGEPGSPLRLEGSEGFTSDSSWSFLKMLTPAADTAEFIDLDFPLAGSRYYRAWQGAPSRLISTLSLGMIPALTLRGSLNDRVRIDCIEEIGPTDAWTTLTTLTLTNASQLFLDRTALGRRPRLYRIELVP